MLLVDLDGFKRVKDAHGHQAGDDLLRAVAGRLRRCARTGDLVAPTGHDEFVSCSPGRAPARARLLAARIRRALAPPGRGRDAEPLIGASIGVAVRPLAVALTERLARADRALYADKRRREARARRHPPTG